MILSKSTQRILLIVVIVGVTLVFTKSIYNYFSFKKAFMHHYYQGTSDITQQVAYRLSTLMEAPKAQVESIINDLANQTISWEKAKAIIAKKPTYISGVGIILVNSSDKTLAENTYFIEVKDKNEFHSLHSYLNSSPAAQWYIDTLHQGKSNYYFTVDPITHQSTLLYSAPLKNSAQTVIGVVFATQSVAHIRHLLTTAYLDQSGYWIVTDANNNLLIHPSTTLVNQHINMVEYATATNDSPLATFLTQISSTLKVSSYESPLLNKKGLIAGITLSPLQWKLIHVVTAPQENNTQQRHLLIQLILITLVLVLSLLIGCFFFFPFISMILSTFICCIFIMAAIGFLWFYVHHYPSLSSPIIPISSKAGLYSIIDTLAARNIPQPHSSSFTDEELLNSLTYRYKQGKYIPTGIFIHDFNFIERDRIEIIALVWQRYFSPIHDGVTRGFFFPQLAGRETITHLSTVKEGQQETVLWLVFCTLNQKISYTNYPFDTKELLIQLAHRDFEKNIMLVPDLDAYSLLIPSALSTVSPHAFLAGWNLTQSSFGYTVSSYTTNFGLYDYGPFGITHQVDKAFTPELTLSVTAQRSLFETLTTDLVTLLVIAILLFIVLLTYSALEFGNTISILVALIFSTILAQLQFTSKIPSHEFVYFESFFFILYVATLVVGGVIVIGHYYPHNRFIRYKNNVISKLLYWPLLLGTLLLVSLWYLY